MTTSDWINPPDAIRRFTRNQVVQHLATIVIFVALAGTAAATAVGLRFAAPYHRWAGIAAALLFLYHLLSLVVIAIRHDLSLEQVAFWPTSSEWRAATGRTGEPTGGIGKFDPAEKIDYLFILLFAFLLVATGLLLVFKLALHLSGGAALDALRLIHSGVGGAIAIHIFLAHVPGRLLKSPQGARLAMFTGVVPLATAVARRGWAAELVKEKTLVLSPTAVAEGTDARESRAVRDILDQGNAFARDGRFTEACAAYAEAIALYPDYSQALFNLGIARMKMGLFDEARVAFADFLVKDPFNPMADKARDLMGKAARGEVS